MARIRSIKPEFWGDRKLARLVTRDARLLYVALWNQADEHSRMQGDSRYVKGHCFPYDDDLDEDAVDRLIDQLAGCGRVVRYAVDGDPYLFLPKLAKHQRLESVKVPSRLPEPPDLSVESTHPAPSADESARRADEPEQIDVQQVAGSRLPVAGGKKQVAGPRDADEPTPDDPTGRLLIEHVRAYDVPPNPTAQAEVKVQIMRLVAQHVPIEHIRAGLTRLRERGVNPKVLPHLVVEATNPPKGNGRSTTDDRVAQAQAVADRYRNDEARGITA